MKFHLLLLIFTLGTLFRCAERSQPDVLISTPRGIMGTSCRLIAVTKDVALGQRALKKAEAELRQIEILMSTYIAQSELSRFNAAGVGDTVRLSAQTLDVLNTARGLMDETEGAFDVTCGGLIDLWKEAGKTGRMPSEDDLRQARDASRWAHIALLREGAVKRLASARVNLGGIAKGYAIDRAVDAMRGEGCEGGLVDVGGDVRCFGVGSIDGLWEIGMRNPFGNGMMDTLAVTDVAVCTSGNYARFVTLKGKRYSHILDPRTGWPTEGTPSVTVIGPTAMMADGWATALSVMGPEGFERRPEGIEAQIVLGAQSDYRVVKTEGFALKLRAEHK